MSPLAKAGALAAVIAAGSAGGISALLHAWREIGSLALIVGSFALLAGVVALTLTYGLCKARLGTARPVLGAGRGSLLALATLFLCTVPHALLLPGAGGVLPSLAGQLIVAGLGLGALVMALGAGVGSVAERLFLSRPSRNQYGSWVSQRAGKEPLYEQGETPLVDPPNGSKGQAPCIFPTALSEPGLRQNGQDSS